MVVASFLVFLVLFVIIGLFSLKQSRHTSKDYLLAGHNVQPWLVALSAVATNNSGYMFIGMIGFTYSTGLSSVWMAIGWVLGDFVASLLVHRQVREMTEHHGVHTYGGLLSHWHDTNYSVLRFIVGLITLLFLGTYAAAQLSAGSKALQVLFGWEDYIGAVIGAVIVLLYSFAGGIRASIWTDAAQSVVMIIAMTLMLYITVDSLGGLAGFIQQLGQVDENFMGLLPPESGYGTLLGGLGFMLGWFFAGYGVAGQPHIMVRFMTMDKPQNIGRVRLYYYSWFSLFYGMTIGVGLAARVLLPEVDNFDAELALPTLAQQLLPQALVGMVLAGIFAATISTADSLILSCSASLTRDFHNQKVDHYLITKGGTVVVSLLALGIALFSDKSVFALVLDAWGVLGAGFAPLLTVYALGRRPNQTLAIAMLLGGILVFYLWPLLLPGLIYATAPGMVTGVLIYIIGNRLGMENSLPDGVAEQRPI
jgi:sodium/proline symporter